MRLPARMWAIALHGIGPCRDRGLMEQVNRWEIHQQQLLDPGVDCPARCEVEGVPPVLEKLVHRLRHVAPGVENPAAVVTTPEYLIRIRHGRPGLQDHQPIAPCVYSRPPQ